LSLTHPFGLKGSAVVGSLLSTSLAAGFIEELLVRELRFQPRFQLYQFLSLQLLLTFQVKFCALNRRIRKMVRNGQKFRRTFSYIRMTRRLAATGRFINYFTKFTPQPRYGDRLRYLIFDAVWAPADSILVGIRAKQQALVLTRLLKV
jgi:hypothetical protein